MRLVLSVLLRVSEGIARARTIEEVAATVIDSGVELGGAGAGAMFTLDEGAGTLVLRLAHGYTPAQLRGYEWIPLSAPLPLAQAVRGAASVFVAGEGLAAYPAIAHSASVTGTEAVAAIPLLLDGRPIGVLGLSWASRVTSERALGEDGRACLEAIARQAAQALDRIRLLEAERTAREAAEHASRLRDDLIAVVSHDLRNPLGSLVSASELLGMKLSPASRQVGERYLQTIERAGHRMTRLLDDLLDLTRIEGGRLDLSLRVEDVGAIVRDAIELHEPLATAKSLRLGLDVLGRVLASCDRHRVQQVIANLLGNAIKFTTEGGWIDVEVARVGDQVRIIVRDSGPGISSEQLPHLFDRYWQARRGTRSGIGLGLSIVRGVVEAHGGTVAVTSQVGVGSQFVVTLPTLLTVVSAAAAH